jgi:hypothetical protein
MLSNNITEKKLGSKDIVEEKMWYLSNYAMN